MAAFTPVFPLAELPPGTSRRVRREDGDVAIFNVGGALYAVDDTCLHAGGPLHEGSIEGSTVICPWHHWAFDLRDGSCALNPFHKLACYEVRVVDGIVQVGFR